MLYYQDFMTKHLLHAFGLVLLLVPTLSLAQIARPVVCGTLVLCATGGAVGLDIFLTQTVFASLQILFTALLILMMFIYSATLVLKSGDESAISEARLAFIYAIAGAAFVSGAMWITAAFSPNTPEIFDPVPAYTFTNNIYLYFRMALGVVLTANLVLQAFRLITSEGNDELIGRARKRILASFIGVGVVLLARPFVDAFIPDASDGGPGNVIIVDEIVGVANFLLVLLSGAAVIAIIVAGIMLVVSLDESLKDKAKQIVRTSLISLAIVLAAYALVNSFILLT